MRLSEDRHHVGFRQGQAVQWHADVGSLTRLKLEHPTSQRMALQFTTEAAERLLPSSLHGLDIQSLVDAHRMHRVCANEPSGIGNKSRGEAAHVGKKRIWHTDVRHGIPRSSIATLGLKSNAQPPTLPP